MGRQDAHLSPKRPFSVYTVTTHTPMKTNRIVCLTGLLLCLFVGGYLRISGYDWGYDRRPDGPHDEQANYIHPDERSVYSKAGGLRWDVVPHEPGESTIDYQLRAAKRRFLDKDSGLNIDSFNYGSLPYYVLILISWLGNTYRAKEVQWLLFEGLLLLFLVRWVLLVLRGWIRKEPRPTRWRFACEVLGFLVIYTILHWLANVLFLPAEGAPPRAYNWHYGSWAFLGRPLSGLAGTLTILYLYRIGARIWNRRVGLLSAIFLTFTVLHIQLCHFYTFDVILAFFTTASVYSLLVLVDATTWCGRWRAASAAAIFAGLGLATKFGAILLFIPWAGAMAFVFWAHRPKSAWWKPRTVGFVVHLLILACFSFGLNWVSAFVGQPFAFLNYRLDKGYPTDTKIPELSFVHLDLRTPPVGKPQSKRMEQLADFGDRLNPYTAPFGFHFAPLLHPDSHRPFENRLTVGGSRHWKDVDEQRNMAVNGGGVPWTRQYNHTTPFVYQWKNLLYYGMGIPLGLLCLLGLFYGFGMPIYRPTWKEWIVWLWMAPNFVTTMLFHTKFPRYLIPQVPFYCLWGAALAIMAYAIMRKRWFHHQELVWRWHYAAGGLALAAVVWSALYAFAFSGIYRDDHVWTVCSKWFDKNVPEGKKIVTETWDDSVPWDGRIAGRYQHRGTNPVHSDEPGNMREIAKAMAWTDYYCFSSKRNYGAFLQSPETSPNRVRMVKSLFAGNLGLRLVKTFSHPVSVLGIPIHFELADESLSLYDHPTVHIFEQVDKLKADEIYARFSDPPAWIDNLTKEQILTADETRSLNAPHANHAMLAWLGMLVLMGWLFWPMTFCLFRSCMDRGVFASKMLSLVLITYGTWLGASVGWWQNAAWATTLVLIIGLMVSALCFQRVSRQMATFLKEHWRLVITSEILFFLAFSFFMGIRISNPDINWGEKAMDASFVNAAYKNNTFPAADPWFAGTPANYYYYGHLMVGLYGRWLGVPPEYAYNLAAGTWPALTFILIFGIVFNLVGRSLPALIAAFLATMAGSVKSFIQIAVNLASGLHLAGGPADPKEFREGYVPHDGLSGYFADAWEQLKAAFSLFPLVFGKVWIAFLATWDSDYLKQAQEEKLNTLFGFDAYFWKLSRIIKSSVACEFPAWSATFADLHAHLLIMPVGMLTLSLILAYCIRRSEQWKLKSIGDFHAAHNETGGPVNTALHVLTIGLLLGVVSITNTWDYPGLVGFFAAGVLLLYLSERRNFTAATSWGLGRAIVRMRLWGHRLNKLAWWKMGFLAEVILPVVMAVVLSRVFFYPFHQSFTTPDRVKGIGWMHLAGSGWTTPDELIQIFGVFLLIILTGLVMLYWRWTASTRWAGFKAVVWIVLAGVVSLWGTLCMRELARPAFDPTWVHTPPAKSNDIPYWKYLDGDIAYVTGGFVFFLLLLLIPFLIRRGTSFRERLGGLVLALGLAIVAGCEVVYIIEGWAPPTHRWNTIFKFHLQAWLCFSIGCGWLLANWWTPRVSLDARPFRILSRTCRYVLGYPLLIAALVLGALFPMAAPYIFSHADGLEGRTRQIAGVKTVDGLNFLRVREPDVAAGIDWLRANINGVPVVAEAAGESYRDERSRFSTHTGLPTLIGWVHHSRERGNSPEPRIDDCRLLYTSTNREKVRDLLKKEEIRYVIVGPIERSLYAMGGGKGLAKFNEWPDLFRPVFESQIKAPGVTIYAVDPSYRLQAGAVTASTKEASYFVKDQGLPLLRGAEGFGPGQYREPRAISIADSGQCYVADTQNHRIQSFDPQANFLWTLGEQGEEPAFFKEPNDLQIDNETGHLYVMDTWNGRVQVFSTTGELSQLFPTEGAFGPRGIAVGRVPIGQAEKDNLILTVSPELAAKLVYIADTGRKLIQVYTPEGKKTSEFGNFGSDQQKLSEPVDLEVTPLGLAVTDARNQRIVFFDGRGRYLREWKIPTEPTGGTTNEMHVCWDFIGHRLLVTDPEHNQVFAFNNQGEVTVKKTVAGSPTGIDNAPDGRIFVTLRQHHRVVLVDLQ